MQYPRKTPRDLLPKRVDYSEQKAGYLSRARYLPEGDRLLLDLFFERGLTRQAIGRVFKLPTGTVSRRLNKLTVRLTDPLVCALVDAPERELAAVHRSIGVGHFLCRRPVTHLAREHGMTSREVKQVLAFLRGWHSRSNGR